MPWVFRLPANAIGRDFVVGDLHGCYRLLRRGLEAVAFNPSRDRLFCVGDLVDRGEESLDCLRLLREPWFFSAMGNHELMLLAHFGASPLPWPDPLALLANGGGWVRRLAGPFEVELQSLLPLVRALPFVIEVEGAVPFRVVHAQAVDERLENWLPVNPSAGAVQEFAWDLVWGRTLAREGWRAAGLDRPPAAPSATSPTPTEPGVPHTYVGHCIVPRVLRHRSHVFIDTGAVQAALGHGGPWRLSIVEHGCRGVRDGDA